MLYRKEMLMISTALPESEYRGTKDQLEQLADAIEKNGIRPLTVTVTRYGFSIVDGKRRLAALRLIQERDSEGVMLIPVELVLGSDNELPIVSELPIRLLSSYV